MKNRKQKNIKPQIIELYIDSLAAGGDGVGRVSVQKENSPDLNNSDANQSANTPLGKVCFVPHTAPGDTVRAKVVSSNKKMMRATLVEVVSPGPGRQKPFCMHFGQCGGCQWMHLSSEVQLQAKADILKRALETEHVQMVPSPNTLGYRQLARLHLISRINKPPVLGFTKNKGIEVVDIAECPILSKQLMDCVEPLKKGPLAHVKGKLEIRLSGGQNGPVVSFSSPVALDAEVYRELSLMVPKYLAGAVVEVDGIRSIVAGTGDIVIADNQNNDSNNCAVIMPAGSFGQANLQINELLKDTIARWVEKEQFESAIELFAGAGNFSLVIGAHVKKLATAELDKEACKAARKNIELKKIKGVTVCQGDAAQIYRRQGSNCDLVVLDPPRTGNMDLAGEISQGDHRAVIYISCNPATLARDLAPLYFKGYKLKQVVGFDMFPHTAHMEAAVLLTR